MVTPLLNSFPTSQINFVPFTHNYPSPLLNKYHTIVAMAKNPTQIGVRVREVATYCHSERTIKDVGIEGRQFGIGIVRFLRGKELLVTGATGFLAKVLVEKILREVPALGKIYLLIKASSEDVAIKRFQSEIVNAKLFKLLQEAYGDSYNTFMRSKLIPVIGNICDSNLGIEEDLACQIASNVNIIVNSPANTTFDENYDIALNINTNGPCNIISFAKRFKQLNLFLHVSTAYVNGKREGKIMEKPFRMGDCIARENHYSRDLLTMKLDVKSELAQFAFNGLLLKKYSSTRERKELGMARANEFGLHNTYELTKVMGEMMIDEMIGDIPVVIVRPTTIESTLKEPFPGWIQGNRVMDPFIVNYGNGKLPGFPIDPNAVFDIIPVDLVVNTILAAIARHGSVHEPGRDINVYHVGSSVANPIFFRDLVEMFYEHFKSRPYIDPHTGTPVKVSPYKIFSSIEDYLSKSVPTTMEMENISPNVKRPLKRSMEHFANICTPYTFYDGRFDISNTQRLMECMSEEEELKFGFDVRSINWKHYIAHVHIPGVRRHVMETKSD